LGFTGLKFVAFGSFRVYSKYPSNKSNRARKTGIFGSLTDKGFNVIFAPNGNGETQVPERPDISS